jgi:alkylation response protein AidB-like acyl-CoA dehydrogenase
MRTPLQQLSHDLARLATHYDISGEWPERSLARLTEAGAWAWMVPAAFGGTELALVPQLQAYEAVAAGCMSSLLILSQRDGACELIAGGRNDRLKRELLPRLAANEMMASVGISQITTSHQGGKPALTAEPAGDGYCLRGFMPWVTSAEKCDVIVAGAVLPDGRQVLLVVRTDLRGVQIDRAMNLMALECTRTAEVHCRDVVVESAWVIAPPAEKALSRTSPVKIWTVVASGIGLAGTMIELIGSHTERGNGALREQAEDLFLRYRAIRERMYKSAEELAESEENPPITGVRVAVNDLLVRLAVATLVFAKGSGFIRQRDAQRLVREAMFFLVWSAPEDVRSQTLAGFLDPPLPESKSLAT